MNIKVKVNPEFGEAEGFLHSLPNIFSNKGKTLKNERNEIKIIQHGEHKFCIKSFNKVTTFNRYMYSWFRSTKAERSYKVARRLEKSGIQTPQPVGYVEVYDKLHVLENAYYVSLYHEHEFDMKDVLEKSLDCQDQILSSFAKEMALVVHPAGAWHNDLSPGNVLINRKGENDWSFSFIDLNRLSFKPHIFPAQGLANLKKLTNQPVALALMAEEYALQANRNPGFYSLLLQRNNIHFTIRRVFTKRILGVFKPRKNKTSTEV